MSEEKKSKKRSFLVRMKMSIVSTNPGETATSLLLRLDKALATAAPGLNIKIDADIERARPSHRGRKLSEAQLDLLLAVTREDEGYLVVNGSRLRTAKSLVDIRLLKEDHDTEGRAQMRLTPEAVAFMEEWDL